MLMAKFNPPKDPSYEVEKITRIRLLRALFGDTTADRETDGPCGEFTLTWSGLTIAEANRMDNFFEAHGGYESFDYALPREPKARKFICREWTRQPMRPGYERVCTKFEEVFDE